jgi:spore coat polysaccharide biosynthesis predicted glycosyltransferase SpsG
MRIVFRADASPQIGSGHVMRVTTIAQEAIARGYECHFVGRIGELAWVEKYVRALGFESINQDVTNRDSKFQSEILVFDSYTIALDSDYINPNYWKLVICVIDEFSPNYSADIYVNQSMAKKSLSRTGTSFNGPEFALIRSSIKKTLDRKVFDFPPTILILGGGSDPYGFVKAVLQKLSDSGSLFFAHVFSNESLDGFSGLRIYQHQIGLELDEVANDVDFAITTASTSSIEFIAREIPTLVACAVDNQEKFYSELAELGLAIPIGVRDSDGEWQLDLQTIKETIEDPKACLELRRRIHGVIDLKGPSRIMDEIELRIAEENLVVD